MTPLIQDEMRNDATFREIVRVLACGYDSFVSAGNQEEAREYLERAKALAGGDLGRLARAQEAAIRWK